MVLQRDKNYPTAAPTFTQSSFDVKNSFPWTLSNNKTLRNYVPTLFLTEYKLTRSGELQSLLNTLLGIAESKTATATLGAAAAGTGLNVARSIVPPGSRAGRVLNSPVTDLAASAAGALAALGVKNVTGVEEATLNPYRGLYPAEPTFNVYALPYLNIDNMTETAGSWRAADESNITSKIGAVAGGVASTAGDLESAATKLVGLAGGMYRGLKTLSQLEVALTQPGAAQEKIKAFAPNDTGDSMNLSFYLYNTTDVSFLKKNWDFLFQLTYQNLPNRKSVNALDPPCVYEVVVPGYKRFPIAVIESFKVTNEGTTRMVNLRTGEVSENAQDRDVKIIPEAYKVTLKITSLLSNTRNLYYYMYNQTENLINVFNAPASRSPAASPSNTAAPSVGSNTQSTLGGARSPQPGVPRAPLPDLRSFSPTP